jgi:hypothetical protein
MDLYKTIMFGKLNFSRQLNDIETEVVPVANKFDYCINHRAETLKLYRNDNKKLRFFIFDIEPR